MEYYIKSVNIKTTYGGAPQTGTLSTNRGEGDSKSKQEQDSEFDHAGPNPIFYKYSETRPISDGFRKNNVNYWAFREIRSIIPHL